MKSCRNKRVVIFRANWAEKLAVAFIWLAIWIFPDTLIGWAAPRIDVYSSGQAKESAAISNRALSILARLDDEFGLMVEGPITIKIADSYSEFQQIQPPGVRLPGWAAGAAFPELNLILINRAASGGEPEAFDKTLAHELAHLVLEGLFKNQEAPRWLNEGLAMHLADDWDIGRQVAMGRAVLTERLIPMFRLMEDFPENRIDAETAYSQSYYFLAFLKNRYGRDSLGRLIRFLALGVRPENALRQTTGLAPSRLEEDFHQWLSRRFSVFWIIFGPVGWWGLCVLLLIVGYVVRRRSARRKLAKWKAEDDDDDDGSPNDSLLFGGPGSSDRPDDKA